MPMKDDNFMSSLIARHHRILNRTLGLITVYYIALALVIAALIGMFPGIVSELPLGGVS